MNFKIEAQRKKFITKYNINMQKYTTDEIVDQLEENISKVVLFWVNILIPILITCLISITISVYFAYKYHSILFGICLFVFSIPIFLFGSGSFGAIWVINNLFSCIDFMTNYTLNIIKDIKKINNSNSNDDIIMATEICEFTLYGIVFPVIKKIIRNGFIGGILNFFIKKITVQGSKILPDLDEISENASSDEIITDSSEKRPTETHKRIKDISKKAIANTILLVKVFGIISIAFGIILEILLFVMH